MEGRAQRRHDRQASRHALAFAWGFDGVGVAVACARCRPWSLRFAGSGIGAAHCSPPPSARVHHFPVPRGDSCHVIIAGFFNVAAFQIFSGFAQLERRDLARHHHHLFDAIWTTVLSHLVLGERLNRVRIIAFVCASPVLTILVWPLFAEDFRLSYFIARLRAELALRDRLHQMGEGHDRAAGQRSLAIAVRILFIAAGTFAFRGQSAPVAAAQRDRRWRSCSSACSASASRISCGGRSSAGCRRSRPRSARCWCRSSASPPRPFILGERPTVANMVGFVMIFAAAACVCCSRTCNTPRCRSKFSRKLIFGSSSTSSRTLPFGLGAPSKPLPQVN